MHPSETGKNKNWSRWKKGTYVAKPRNPYDVRRINLARPCSMKFGRLKVVLKKWDL
jgi:hypothetical protein